MNEFLKMIPGPKSEEYILLLLTLYSYRADQLDLSKVFVDNF